MPISVSPSFDARSSFQLTSGGRLASKHLARQRIAVEVPARGTPLGIGAHQGCHAKVAGTPAILVLDHLGRRAIGDDLSVPEQENTARVRQCKVYVVRDEVDRLELGDR